MKCDFKTQGLIVSYRIIRHRYVVINIGGSPDRFPVIYGLGRIIITHQPVIIKAARRTCKSRVHFYIVIITGHYYSSLKSARKYPYMWQGLIMQIIQQNDIRQQMLQLVCLRNLYFIEINVVREE